MSVTVPGVPQRLLYGRRRGRALRPGQRLLLETTLPQLAFAPPASGALDPHELFSAPRTAIWLELGFGGGEHLAAQAAAHPAIGLIGAEVFENGVAKLLVEIERRGLANIRLFIDDARILVASLAAACLDRVFILFPDPWPKERHKKRRLVSRALLDALAAAMADGAELRLATDDADYAEAMLACACAHADFEIRARGAHPWRERPGDWPRTRYEEKAIAAGRAPVYLRLARRPRAVSLLAASAQSTIFQENP
jgi:tRNA (guanine-N7-)-methyltransferase